MLLIVAAHATRADVARTTDGRGTRVRFRAWRRRRPFVGGLLTALGGVEMFFSGQLDIGRIHVQLGIEGLQATIIPIVLVLLGVLVMAMPAHRIFYGVIALAVAVYSLVGVNLGGFFIGMLLSTIGGILTVAWMPKADAATETEADAATSSDSDTDPADAAADDADDAAPVPPREGTVA